MTVLVYVGFCLILLSFCLTIFYFLKLLASLQSLRLTTMETSKDRPTESVLSAGIAPLVQVLADGKNKHARKALLKHAAFFVLFGAITLGPALYLSISDERGPIAPQQER